MQWPSGLIAFVQIAIMEIPGGVYRAFTPWEPQPPPAVIAPPPYQKQSSLIYTKEFCCSESNTKNM